MPALMVIGQIIVAVLAVFGLLFLWCFVFALYFAPPAVSAVVVVSDMEHVKNLDILLLEAEKSVFRRKGVPIVVLISPPLMEGVMGNCGGLYPAYETLLLAHGAVAYIGSQPSSE